MIAGINRFNLSSVSGLVAPGTFFSPKTLQLIAEKVRVQPNTENLSTTESS
jgi:hypothetical protein